MIPIEILFLNRRTDRMMDEFTPVFSEPLSIGIGIGAFAKSLTTFAEKGTIYDAGWTSF